MEIDQPTEQDLDLVALAPSDLAPTQQALSGWCDEKMGALVRELADLDEHLLIASANGWKLRGLQASINRTQKRITYYEKMRAAVEAGYLMVPNFPVTVLAVRVARAKQRPSFSRYGRHFPATAELLPAGSGRYVDEALFSSDLSHQESDGKGGTKTVTQYMSGEYDEPDFPYHLMKPTVLAKTQQAMALKLFDQIGMVQNTAGRDPIMVGQLIDPRGNDRRATFFIAWWLNTRDL